MTTNDELDQLLANITAAVTARKHDKPGADLDILTALQKMHSAVEGPAAYLIGLRLQPMLNIAMIMALESGMLEALVKLDGEPVTAAKLSKQCGYPQSFTMRVMRLLAAAGVGEELEKETYRSNTLAVVANAPGSRGSTRMTSQINFPIAANLVPYMRSGQFCEFPDAPGTQSAFMYAHKTDLWGLLASDAQLKAGFDALMTLRRDASAARPWFEIYPAAERLAAGERLEGDRALIVDVAGGAGHDVASFRARYPELHGRFVLQDLSETLAGVKLETVEKQAYDFFQPQPEKGARAYFFRGIMHDWPDEKCRTILKNTIEAMDPEQSVILLEDRVLPDVGASLRSASIDMLMLLMTTGIERTRSQWAKLLDSVDLEIVKIYGENEDYESIIEARLKSEKGANTHV